VAVLLLLTCGSGAAADSARVGVVDCPVAGTWLRSTGIDCRALAATELGTVGLADLRLLILPLDRVRSEEPLRQVTAFAARGGKVIAVYWGTLTRQEWQADSPVYKMSAALGFHVVGWRYEGPAVVKTDPSSAPTAVSNLRLDQMMLLRVEPDPPAQVIARLVPDSGAAPAVLALRNGNFYYVAANLFHRGSDPTGVRRFFFWMLDQAVPGLVFSQARERAGSAVAAVIRARERLKGSSSPNAAAVRRLLDDAQQSADRARTLAAGEQYAESAAAADQSRDLTERALQLLERQ
jgi:hypothetical protein